MNLTIQTEEVRLPNGNLGIASIEFPDWTLPVPRAGERVLFHAGYLVRLDVKRVAYCPETNRVLLTVDRRNYDDMQAYNIAKTKAKPHQP